MEKRGSAAAHRVNGLYPNCTLRRYQGHLTPRSKHLPGSSSTAAVAAACRCLIVERSQATQPVYNHVLLMCTGLLESIYLPQQEGMETAYATCRHSSQQSPSPLPLSASNTTSRQKRSKQHSRRADSIQASIMTASASSAKRWSCTGAGKANHCYTCMGIRTMIPGGGLQ